MQTVILSNYQIVSSVFNKTTWKFFVITISMMGDSLAVDSVQQTNPQTVHIQHVGNNSVIPWKIAFINYSDELLIACTVFRLSHRNESYFWKLANNFGKTKIEIKHALKSIAR